MMDIRSPDGAWVATARTDQWGGFGSAYIETTVSLKRLDGTINRGKPFEIFSYPGGGKIPKTYELNTANADQDLQIVWLSPTQLFITHASAIDPDLVVTRFANVDIKYRYQSVP
jgi:hypothetical protein